MGRKEDKPPKKPKKNPEEKPKENPEEEEVPTDTLGRRCEDGSSHRGDPVGDWKEEVMLQAVTQ